MQFSALSTLCRLVFFYSVQGLRVLGLCSFTGQGLEFWVTALWPIQGCRVWKVSGL